MGGGKKGWEGGGWEVREREGGREGRREEGREEKMGRREKRGDEEGGGDWFSVWVLFL